MTALCPGHCEERSDEAISTGDAARSEGALALGPEGGITEGNSFASMFEEIRMVAMLS